MEFRDHMRSTKSHTTANSVSSSVWKSNPLALLIGTTPLTPRVRTEWFRSRRIRSKRGRLNGICQHIQRVRETSPSVSVHMTGWTTRQ